MKGKIYWVVLLLTLLSSCHTASYHFEKFQKKGGKINCVTDTLKVVDGDTIIFEREKLVRIECPTPETNSQTRQQEKTKRKELDLTYKLEVKKLKASLDSMELDNKRLKLNNEFLEAQAKEHTKQKKEEEKTKRNESDNQRKEAKGWAWWKWMLLGASIGAVIALLLRTIIKQYIRK